MPAGTVDAQAIIGINKSTLTTDSNPYKFSVYRSGNQTILSSTTQKIALNGELFDTNNNFDSTTNFRYVAPVAAFYWIDAKAANNGNGGFNVYLFKNGALLKELYVTTLSSGRSAGGGGALIQLAASDYIELHVVGDNTTIVGGADATYMTGFLVCRT